MKTLPDVVCIGTYKCATTYLFHMLRQHPGVHVPDFKEVHFFSTIHGDGLWERQDWDWYASLFSSASPGSVAVEFSPGYMIEPEVADRLARHLPRANLLSVIRDPVERARSHYYYLNNGKFPLDYSMNDLALQQDAVDRPGRTHILGHGLYWRNLQPFLEKFGRQRIHFVIQEEMKAAPARCLAEVCRFIGVDEEFVPADIGSSVNSAQAFRSRKLYWLQYRIATKLERSGFSSARKALKATGIPGLIKRLNTKPQKNPPLSDDETRALRDYYRADVRRLSAECGVDLEKMWWETGGSEPSRPVSRAEITQ